MADYFDRKGKPITEDQWLRRFKDKDYQIIKQDHVGDKMVSTVWLGLDHSFGDEGDPLIFETMIFEAGEWAEQFCRRYSREFAAIEGHAFALKVAAGEAKPDEGVTDPVTGAALR
jgi:hypothetical protein